MGTLITRITLITLTECHEWAPNGVYSLLRLPYMDRMDLLMASLASCLFAGDVQVPLVHVADAPEP
jgi:hypothetical protein